MCALSRGTLKRKSGRNTIHFTADSRNIELMRRTTHSANQLSIDGAVSSWCIDLAEKMHGQTSSGVDRSMSEENVQLSKQLDPQEVGSLVRNQPKTEGAAGNCWRDHFSVIMAIMELKFKSPLHLETTPMFGWSCPEAQIATWMRYDTETQKSLLKKLITSTCRTRIKSKRPPNWKCQTITFRFLNGNGKTSLPMNAVTDTRGNLRSRNLSVNWSRHENYREQGNRWSNSLDNAESEAQMYVPKGWTP